MKNAIILHGRPSKKGYYDPRRQSQSNSHWIPWLQRQLLLEDILTQTPELPQAYDPIWEEHRREFERYDVNLKTILVGHSFGGGFLVRWLSEHPEVQVGRVVLVAPYIDVEQENEHRFFDFKIDENLVGRTKGLTIFISDDEDAPEIVSSVKKLRVKLKNIGYKKFHGYGHFTFHDMKTRKFPELFEECLK